MGDEIIRHLGKGTGKKFWHDADQRKRGAYVTNIARTVSKATMEKFLQDNSFRACDIYWSEPSGTAQHSGTCHLMFRLKETVDDVLKLNGQNLAGQRIRVERTQSARPKQEAAPGTVPAATSRPAIRPAQRAGPTGPVQPGLQPAPSGRRPTDRPGPVQPVQPVQLPPHLRGTKWAGPSPPRAFAPGATPAPTSRPSPPAKPAEPAPHLRATAPAHPTAAPSLGLSPAPASAPRPAPVPSTTGLDDAATLRDQLVQVKREVEQKDREIAEKDDRIKLLEIEVRNLKDQLALQQPLAIEAAHPLPASHQEAPPLWLRHFEDEQQGEASKPATGA